MAPILQSDAPILECDIHRVPVGFRRFYPYEYIIFGCPISPVLLGTYSSYPRFFIKKRGHTP